MALKSAPSTGQTAPIMAPTAASAVANPSDSSNCCLAERSISIGRASCSTVRRSSNYHPTSRLSVRSDRDPVRPTKEQKKIVKLIKVFDK